MGYGYPGRAYGYGGGGIVDLVAPTITSAAVASVAENATLAHSLTADEAVTWSISGGADALDFEIAGSTLRWNGNGTKDFDAPDDGGGNNVYDVQVTATDGGGNVANQAIAVTVTNVLEVTLGALSLSASTIAENSAQGTAIGNIVGASSGSVLSILSQERANWFQLVGGQLQVGSGSVDYETDTSATVTIRETHADATNSPRDTVLNVTITNVAETLTIQYVGGKTQAIPGTTSNTVISLTDLIGGLATQPAAGDIVIVGYAAVSTVGDDVYSVTTAGYTEIVELFANDDVDTNFSVSYKVMGGTPDTNVTVSPTLNVAWAGAVAIHVWRNVDAVTPLDVASTTATGVSTDRPNPPAITPVSAGAVVVAFGGAGQNGSTTSPFAQSGSELSNFISVGSPDTSSAAVGAGSFAWTSGAFNPVAWVGGANSASSSWAAVTLALRPGTA